VKVNHSARGAVSVGVVAIIAFGLLAVIWGLVLAIDTDPLESLDWDAHLAKHGPYRLIEHGERNSNQG
jgi:hypothetical protein